MQNRKIMVIDTQKNLQEDQPYKPKKKEKME